MSDRSDRLIAQLTASPSEEQFAALYEMMREAEHLADEDSPRLQELIAAINAATPLQTDRAFFASLYGWSSADELAQTWAVPLPERVGDLSDEELLAIIVSLNDHIATPQIDRFLHFLSQSLVAAFNTDLIFWPYSDLAPEELVAEIRKRQTLFEESGALGLREYEVTIARQIIADENSPPPKQTWAYGVLKSIGETPTPN